MNRVAVLFLLLFAGCPMKPVYVSQLMLHVTAPASPGRSTLTLYLFASDQGVPDKLTTPGGEVKPIEIHGLRSFVSRDLKRFFERHFAEVVVLDDTAKLPKGDAVIARVRISRLATELEQHVLRGRQETLIAYRIFGVLDWSLDITVGDQLAYTFADHSRSTQVLYTVDQTDELLRSTLGTAMQRMIDDYSKHDVATRFLDKGLHAGDRI
jgi:hypothetical protein